MEYYLELWNERVNFCVKGLLKFDKSEFLHTVYIIIIISLNEVHRLKHESKGLGFRKRQLKF